MDTTPVRLTRKYADMIDGVDLHDAEVGDELRLSHHDADVLVAEGWAERTKRSHVRSSTRASATDKGRDARRPRR